jgi:hypothetical protein
MAKRKRTKGHTMIYKQKDRQYNGQKKKYKRTHNDLHTEGQTIVLSVLIFTTSGYLFVIYKLFFEKDIGI